MFHNPRSCYQHSLDKFNWKCSLWKIVGRLEKSRTTPLVTLVTNMKVSCGIRYWEKCTICCLLNIIDNVFGNVLLGVVHLPVIVLFHTYCFIEGPGRCGGYPHRKEAGGGVGKYPIQPKLDLTWSVGGGHISHQQRRDGQSIWVNFTTPNRSGVLIVFSTGKLVKGKNWRKK